MTFPEPLHAFPGYKIFRDMEGAESIRNEQVPEYRDCRHSRVTGQPWAFDGEETPLYVDCRHRTFRGECLGQCSLHGMRYGSAR